MPITIKAIIVGVSLYPNKNGAKIPKIELTIGEDSALDIHSAKV
jgi:hypothetical protein